MKALIFDCDGTLIDTMPNHYKSWLEVLSPVGIPFSETEFYALGGWSAHGILKKLAHDHNKSLDIDALALEKDLSYDKYMHQVRPLEAVVNIAREARGTVPMGVGTGGTRPFCTSALKRIGIFDWFDVIVCAEDVAHCKPAPDTFLLCAHQLKTHPSDCLVYEDTDPGIEAARAAGMKAVDVRELLRVEAIRDSQAKH